MLSKGKDLSGRGQRVGNDKADGFGHVHIFSLEPGNEVDVLGLVELAHDRDSLIHATACSASMTLRGNRKLSELSLIQLFQDAVRMSCSDRGADSECTRG